MSFSLTIKYLWWTSHLKYWLLLYWHFIVCVNNVNFWLIYIVYGLTIIYLIFNILFSFIKFKKRTHWLFMLKHELFSFTTLYFKTFIFFNFYRRHRCPHRPTNHLSQGDGNCRLTEYNNVYKAHPLGLRESFKPNQQPMQGGEFQDKTTQR